MHELEAKFLTADGDSPEDVLRRLHETLAGAGYRIEPNGRRSFTDRYFDTADHGLRGAGWSYRERRDDHGRQVALKEINRSRAAIFDREEVEQPLRPDEHPGSLGAGPVKARLSNLLPPHVEVTPLFAVANERAAYSLSHPDHPRGLVEMAFDQARIDAGDAPAFQELALELKDGSHDLLAQVLAAVETEPALIEARLSTFERGLMAAGWPLERRRGLPPKPLDRHARWLDLAVVQLKAELYRIRLYEPFAWEGLHAEGVHRMRMALRRARNALHTFADVLPPESADDLAARLEWMSGVLGPVRDLDVLAAHLGGYSRAADPAHRAVLEGYRVHLRSLHQSAHRELLAALSGREWADLLAAYRTLLAEAARPERPSPLLIDAMAAPSVTPLLDRLQRRGRAVNDDSPHTHLQPLRVDARRLCDHIEMLQQAYPRELTDVVPALHVLLERLGAHQQACVARAHLARYRKRHRPGQLERSLFRHLMRLEKRRAHRHRKRVADAWTRFEVAAAGLLQRLSG